MDKSDFKVLLVGFLGVLVTTTYLWLELIDIKKQLALVEPSKELKSLQKLCEEYKQEYFPHKKCQITVSLAEIN